ncbi:hypothetical protein [Paenibacillus radicis (ex Xue et al. 2023)]|uniref:Uncharacterized protein n=1 Tax=Paenibacillus radicis (ex Xue et al. 2023) TaxID=2972489 RepID=A0ABT1YJC4_9BACL|nr:hypothetical protein [Paenibacillus radicis (ex Xue et al. 2023)]MCR8633293.1 hypothetical protein [Paenibacillus radicis (ex Xue et al. 2023)]
MNPGQNDKRKFLFNVDILIEEDSNGRALEKLLHVLNSTDIQDYLIKEGILLGKTIEIALRETISKKKPSSKETPALTPKQDVEPKAGNENPHRDIWKQFQHFKQNNTLIRLTIIKGKGIKLSIPCRILNVDLSTDNVSVYHVDEKQVYLFKINEIEDFAVSS